jgi:hypothetical protein
MPPTPEPGVLSKKNTMIGDVHFLTLTLILTLTLTLTLTITLNLNPNRKLGSLRKN